MGIGPLEIEGSILTRFRWVADSYPDHPAVCKAEDKITFSELDAGSDRVAGLLLERRGPDSEPIAIALPPGPLTLTAMMGVLKAGKLFVLLSPDVDPNQLAGRWNNTLRPPILTDAETRPLAESLAGNAGLLLDVHTPPASPFDSARVRTGPDSPAMLTYSSGTTSTPKGVISTHRMILHSTAFYTAQHGYGNADRISYLGAFSSSHAMSYNLYTVLCGATLVFPPDGKPASLPYIEWLDRERITVLSITALPVLQQYMRACPAPPPLPDLREITVGGQEFTREELEELRRFFPPHVMFTHRLASSDLNQISEFWILPGTPTPWEKIPVGKGVPGKEVLLLDDDLQPVPDGEIGQIAVRSRYLPTEYWHQPELTRERFLPDPDGGDLRIFLTGDLGRFLPGGLLEFHGRKDNQVRIQNQNVQLEEVEKALRQISGIGEAVVTVVPWHDSEKRLAAYLAPSGTGAPAVDEIRRALERLLPPHMIPSLYVFLDSFPRLPTGKIDRNRLPPPMGTRPRLSTPFLAPRSEWESRLCAIWEGLLHVDPIGVNDNFYDLGGDSLLALTMTLAVEEAFQRPVPQAYYRSVTVAGLAEIWRREDLQEQPEKTAPAPETHETRKRGTRLPRGKRRIGNAPEPVFANAGISAATLLISQLPFRTGLQMAVRFCSFGPARDRFLRPAIDLFGQFRDSLGGCPQAPERAELISLAGNLLWSSHLRANLGDLADRDMLQGMRHSAARFWRDAARIIDRAPEEEFDRIFQVSGWNHLEDAYRSGRGVVLVSHHSTSNRMASMTIRRRLRSEPVQTVSSKRAQRMHRLRGDSAQADPSSGDSIALVSDLLLQGFHALQRGQIIQLVPDGRDFSVRDETAVICGRTTYLQAGFAKLALLADSNIIPLATTRLPDGSLLFDFRAPLTPRRPESSVEEKIRDLVGQYAAFLQQHWLAHPECVTWSKMRKHLLRPAAPPA